ncbi:MAG: exodeoxyribonuclease VII large subunit [Oscillospiraceae bacterium]|nr:exodeoxyribonuclease VII large subunit [Oscillospiraceae bacterium]
MEKPLVVSVSQVNRRISHMLKNDAALSCVWVRGEVFNFTCHYKSGHIYFTLSDENGESSIKCVMFSNNASRLEFTPEDGMAVTVKGRVDVYERGGIYQLYAEELNAEGKGVQYLEFEQLKQKLLSEGLFSRKRELPKNPASIALVTAKGGAALQDMLSVFERRYPLVKLYLISAAVQGELAPVSISKGIAKACETKAELIILGRGGGSSEDLSAFNTEIVVRAVYNSEIPTICAVGHETDFTLADFAADLRAPTPSAAAEIAVPDIADIKFYLSTLKQGFKSKLKANHERKQFQFERVSEIKYKVKAVFEKKQLNFIKTAELIHSLSPTAIMLKGYSLVYKETQLIKTKTQLNPGDKIIIKMNDGEMTGTIDN